MTTNHSFILGKKVNATDENNHDVIGKVILVYDDAIASGINEYINITEILVEDDAGKIHVVKPRHIIEVVEDV